MQGDEPAPRWMLWALGIECALAAAALLFALLAAGDSRVAERLRRVLHTKRLPPPAMDSTLTPRGPS